MIDLVGELSPTLGGAGSIVKMKKLLVPGAMVILPRIDYDHDEVRFVLYTVKAASKNLVTLKPVRGQGHNETSPSWVQIFGWICDYRNFREMTAERKGKTINE